MSKIFIYLVFIGSMFLSFQAQGQLWFDIAAKGGFGLSGFYVDNVYSDTEHNNQFNTGYTYGLKMGINFGEYNGVSLEALIQNGKQEFQHKIGNGRFPNVTRWQTLDLGAIYRFNAKGSYLEIGPQMSMLRNVEQTYDGNAVELEDVYADSYFSAVAGFGGFIAGSEIFTLVMGLRLGYAFTDMLSSDAQNIANPPPAFYKTYDKYSSLNPFFAQVTVELSFGLGGTARAMCGRRSYMFGSRYR